jgi:hypothetical protein
MKYANNVINYFKNSIYYKGILIFYFNFIYAPPNVKIAKIDQIIV